MELNRILNEVIIKSLEETSEEDNGLLPSQKYTLFKAAQILKTVWPTLQKRD